MAGITASNQNIVNARIMAEMAMEFNIGADILGKGNRHIEKYLGAEKMSGDTVMVPITGGGEVYDHLDLSNEDLSVQRDAVPVTVGPLCTAAAVDQETLTLSIKNPEMPGFSFWRMQGILSGLPASRAARVTMDAPNSMTLRRLSKGRRWAAKPTASCIR